MAGLLEQLDAQIEQLFSSWNLWSTLIFLGLLITVVYTFLSAREPDTHPLLLSRQASVSQVRQPGESAVYRSTETPHGLALRSGLNVKEQGANKWAAGKDGDLRDIWRHVANDENSEDAQSTGRQARLQTVLGREKIIQHDTKDLTQQLNVIGSYVEKKQYKRIATYLPNSVELLLTVFAGAFYEFEVVLISYDCREDLLLELLKEANAPIVIATAGTLPLASIDTHCKDIKEVIWVVEDTSRHMDFEDADDNVATLHWHDLIAQQSGSTSNEVPKDAPGAGVAVQDVVTMSRKSRDFGEKIAFTQKNIVAAVAAQINALPIKERLGSNDVFLPADSLTNHHILVQTLAALFSGASIALNSVAGEEIDLPSACAGVAPTVIAASTPSLLKLYKETASTVDSRTKKLVLRSQTQALRAGYMPPDTLLSGISSPARTALGKVPHTLRLIYAFERSDKEDIALSPDALAELRAFTGARVIHALSAPSVAGAVAQTLFYDYRSSGQLHGRHAHFGPPVSSVELKLVDTESHKTIRNHDPEGQIVVSGAAVVNGEVNLGIIGSIRQDGTLALI